MEQKRDLQQVLYDNAEGFLYLLALTLCVIVIPALIISAANKQDQNQQDRHERFAETCIHYELSEAQCDHLWLLSQ